MIKSNMDTISQSITELGFHDHIDVQNNKSIAQYFRSIDRCGIYILHFANDEIYVGQAIDVRRRYAQHSKNYNDIVRVSFKCTAPHKLNKEEKTTIEILERQRFHLRNIVHTSISYSPSPFDELMTSEDQFKWLHNNTYIDKTEERVNDLGIRKKYQARYEKFLKLPQASEAIEILKSYVNNCIPSFKSGEMYYWCCTCLLEKRPNDTLIYSRININWQEVFTVGTQDDRLFFSWHLANSPIRLTWKNYNFYHQNIYETITSNEALLTEHRYKPGGQDQIQVELGGDVHKAINFMNNPDILYAIKSFNLNLTRKGANPYFKFHCFDLADNFFN